MPYPFARNTDPDLGGCLTCGLAIGYTEHALYNPSGQASGEGVSLYSPFSISEEVTWPSNKHLSEAITVHSV